MAPFAFRRLPGDGPSLMIGGMARFRRALAASIAAALFGAFMPSPARAQGAENGWFEDSNGAPAPMPQQSAPATPAAPAAPAAPNAPPPPPTPAAPNAPAAPESLAPSPLLDRGTSAPAEPTAQDQDPRALSAWNQYVDPYGTWVEDSRYGRVWVPNPAVVGSDFAPYSTGGHWANDENNDWVWVSDYPFGWVTFHYGRWVWIAGRGWAWIPGMQYAPAWVVWRVPTTTYAYVGWAPYPPSYVWFGWGAYYYPYAPIYPWVFCPSAYVYSTHVHTYIVHDHATVGYAARNTRTYNVAPPHAVGGPGGTPVPHGPSPQAAHVPSGAMPAERVSSSSIAARGSASAAISSMHQSGFGARTSASAVTRSPMVPMDQRGAMRQGLGGNRSMVSSRPDTRPQPNMTTMRSSAVPHWSTERAMAPQSASHYVPNRTTAAPRQMSAPHFDPGRTMRSAPVHSTPVFHGGGGGSFHGGGGGGHHR